MTVTSASSQRGSAKLLTAKTLDGLSTVSADDWDALVTSLNGPLSHGYLAAWENCELDDLHSRPVLAWRPGVARPVAACPGYFYRLDLGATRLPVIGPPLRLARRVFPGFLYPLTYELGSPTPLTDPFLVADPEFRDEVIAELLSAAFAQAKRRGAEFLLVQNFASREGPTADRLARLGFTRVPILPTAVLDLPFSSFEDYLDAMRSHYRRRARDKLKPSEHLQVEHVRSFGDLADELARLWRLVYERADEVKREVLTADYFRAMSRLDRASVLLARRPDRSIASFGLLLDHRPWMSWLCCGFEEEAGRSEGAYFRLLYEVARTGIEGGFQQVDMGITTLEPKLEAGAVPIPLYAWIKHRNPIVHRMLRAAARGPMRPQQVQPRHVFKDAPPDASELVARRGLA